MRPSPKKKAKVSSTTITKVETKEEEEEEDKDEEIDERIFAACQILQGNLDGKLDDGTTNDPIELRRGQFVLNLLESDDGPEDQENWSLQTTRSNVQRIQSCQAGEGGNKDNLRKRLGHLLHVGNQDPLDIVGIDKLFRGPIFSFTHVNIANALIDKALSHSSDVQYTQKLHLDAKFHILNALRSWPCNPAALLSIANMERMGNLKSHDDEGRRLDRALDLYLSAGICAHRTRQIALECMDSDDFDNDEKFLFESILLDSTKVEELEDGSYSESEFLVTASSMSALLASMLGKHETAKHVLLRFSDLGKPMTRIHPNVWDNAAIMARGMKPTTTSTTTTTSKVTTKQNPTQAAFCPRVFSGACPEDLSHTLRHAFRPDAPYWKQSGYDRNIYYSFWTDWPLPRPTTRGGAKKEGVNSYLVSNAVEHYIVEHLLPRIKVISPGHDLHALKGFEWWVHTRPSNGANLGHQLHFDTDEALLDQDGIVEFPISASVTYLNESHEGNNENRYGATILFDQTPSTTHNATTAWLNPPKSKSFLIFPGDLLHGVLPCMPSTDDHSTGTKETRMQRSTTKKGSQRGNDVNPDDEDDYGNLHEDKGTSTALPIHRLTFMVNFWSYRIPDRLRRQKLYGPSSPFPPPTRNHSWTEEITMGYPRTVVIPDTIETEGGLTDMETISPAWDSVQVQDKDDDGIKIIRSQIKSSSREYEDWMFDSSELAKPLVMPPSGSGINQRFFVTNTPGFFKGTLNSCDD